MQVIIPMSGFGERFRRAGYTVPKPLIEIEGKPIIAHVVDLFPGEHDFVFICNQEHLDCEEFRIEEILRTLVPTATVVGIAPHKLGPVHAVLAAAAFIKDDEPVVVNYCDFACYWDYAEFCQFVRSTGCDGCIPAYRGFHPHMLGPTNYAFMREQDLWVTDIQEKKPFTDNRMNEYASSGTYYFRSGSLMKQFMQCTVDAELDLNGEYYVSLVYKPMLEAGLQIAVYDLQHFMQWGTPEDVDQYNHYSSVFRNLLRFPRARVHTETGGVLLIPMAGAGSRFVQEGYTLPKPLVPVSGKPMVIQAAADLPAMTRQIFVLRKDLPGLDTILAGIRKEFPSAEFVILPELTDGQARTCLLGLAGVPENAPVTIGACDNGVLFDEAAFCRLENDPDTDVIVWVKRRYLPAKSKPRMYGWVAATSDGTVERVSVKEPLGDPTNDAVVIGAFTFKRAADFIRATHHLIESGVRVNNELYVDSVINSAVALGLQCKILEVAEYVCWGTPDELRSFEYWQSCFSKWPSHPYSLEADSRIPPLAVAELKRQYRKTSAPFPSFRKSLRANG